MRIFKSLWYLMQEIRQLRIAVDKLADTNTENSVTLQSELMHIAEYIAEAIKTKGEE